MVTQKFQCQTQTLECTDWLRPKWSWSSSSGVFRRETLNQQHLSFIQHLDRERSCTKHYRPHNEIIGHVGHRLSNAEIQMISHQSSNPTDNKYSLVAGQPPPHTRPWCSLSSLLNLDSKLLVQLSEKLLGFQRKWLLGCMRRFLQNQRFLRK